MSSFKAEDDIFPFLLENVVRLYYYPILLPKIGSNEAQITLIFSRYFSALQFHPSIHKKKTTKKGKLCWVVMVNAGMFLLLSILVFVYCMGSPKSEIKKECKEKSVPSAAFRQNQVRTEKSYDGPDF